MRSCFGSFIMAATAALVAVDMSRDVGATGDNQGRFPSLSYLIVYQGVLKITKRSAKRNARPIAHLAACIPCRSQNS